jgi:hypothetical protein
MVEKVENEGMGVGSEVSEVLDGCVEGGPIQKGEAIDRDGPRGLKEPLPESRRAGLGPAVARGRLQQDGFDGVSG